MPNLPTPDWPRWFSWKISEADFEKRRELYVRFENYVINFDDNVKGMHMITTDLPKYRERSKPGGLMTSTNQRLWDTLDWLNLQYSAGVPVEQLAQVWPYALEWAEEYGEFHAQYHQSPEAGNYMTPHAALRTEEYWIVALRLTCFGLLSGYAHSMPRVMAFLDYANELMGVRDGLLERLVRPFVPDRGTPPDTCTRHLPYRKLLKVFNSVPAKRPALLKTYLDEWYHASRREPYIDRHERGGFSHFGYWSWEAAAVTWLLRIDDSSYRDMPFYPKDWADFARQYPPPPLDSICRNGDSCPQSGWWWSDASSDSLRRFDAGDVFPDAGTARGIGVWYWALDQRRERGMPNLPTPDWSRWFSWKISETDFEKRRELYVRFENYVINFDDNVKRMVMITTNVPKYRERSKPGGSMTSTRRRLWDTLDWLNLQYSAGAPVEQLAQVWPYALEWAEEYGHFDALFDQSPEAGNYMAPHAALRTEEYWIVALRLTCFGLLSGYAHCMPRVIAFLDYANELMGVRDGLLERLVRPFVPDRGTPPDTCTRHLPYRKLLKVFNSVPAKRPALLKTYLDEWYHASRREPYIDRHERGGFSHFGYWSWEAAAVTWLLRIDDSSYRDMPFYPKDWADFARQYPPPPLDSIRRNGDSCPQSGWWSATAEDQP